MLTYILLFHSNILNLWVFRTSLCFMCVSYLCPRHLSLQVAGHTVHSRALGQLSVSRSQPLRERVQLLTQLPRQLQTLLQLRFALGYLKTCTYTVDTANPS